MPCRLALVLQRIRWKTRSGGPSPQPPSPLVWPFGRAVAADGRSLGRYSTACPRPPRRPVAGATWGTCSSCLPTADAESADNSSTRCWRVLLVSGWTESSCRLRVSRCRFTRVTDSLWQTSCSCAACDSAGSSRREAAVATTGSLRGDWSPICWGRKFAANSRPSVGLRLALGVGLATWSGGPAPVTPPGDRLQQDFPAVATTASHVATEHLHAGGDVCRGARLTRPMSTSSWRRRAGQPSPNTTPSRRRWRTACARRSSVARRAHCRRGRASKCRSTLLALNHVCHRSLTPIRGG